MKLIIQLLALLLITSSVNAQMILETFEEDEIGLHPKNWYDRDTNFKLLDYNDKVKSTYKYRVLEEDGNKFLRYEGQKAMHINYPLYNLPDINIYDTPILSWRMRIHSIPLGANEDDKDKNDVAASIYIVFDFGRVLFRKVPKSIRYTWSSTLPVGTELSKFYGNQKIVVVGTGNNKQGEWQLFERNIVEDYKRLFKDDPPSKPLALLILSDGNDTGKDVKADYDDFQLKGLND